MIFLSRGATSEILLRNRYWRGHRFVSAWTPLATAFNAPPVRRINFTREDVVSAAVGKPARVKNGRKFTYIVSGLISNARTKKL